MARTSYIQWNDDDVCFVLDQHSELDFYSASSLKQQSADRHVVPLRHIILISSQPIFALTPKCSVLSGEATNTNFIVFGLTRPELKPTIYRTWDKHTNHYTTDVVFSCNSSTCLLNSINMGSAFKFPPVCRINKYNGYV